jgi:uncharacterized protein involved in exopolysaccharide biosynthesis
MAFSCRWLNGSRWIRHLKTSDTSPLDHEWQLRLRALSQRLNVHRPVALFKSALVEVPLVIGWLRPVILLPASALSGLTPDQLEAILAHELAHVRRCDYLVNAFQNVVETLMFYHPAVWWISSCIREEREQCCDDLVVSACGNRVTYARALLFLEEARGLPRLALAANGGSLIYRVRRLLGISREGCPPSAAELTGIALMAFGFVMILAATYLLSVPSVYQAASLIKLAPPIAWQPAGGRTDEASGVNYPVLLQTECLVIRSPAVLERVINSMKLADDSSNAPGRFKALSQLGTRLSLRPIPSTSVIEIKVSDPGAAEAARIANAVAVAYKEHCQEQRREALSTSVDTLQVHFDEQDQKIRKSQQEVDRLRAKLNGPDGLFSENAPLSENNPVVPLTAETLRRIENLRIESQADYLKQKALLSRLTALDPSDLPATLQGVGVQDNQLTSLSESLSSVDQKLVSLQKELGPGNTEVIKATAQQKDLRQKIDARTRGILMGLEAKVESTAEGIFALSNEVTKAQAAADKKVRDSQAYLEAKRDLEELIRFRQILGSKIAMERADLQFSQGGVEILEEAIAPTQAMSPNRPRAFAFLSTGCTLALFGWLLARTGRPGMPMLQTGSTAS